MKKLQKDRGFKSVEARFDEEHNLWEVAFTNSQGAEHVINWELASTPEYRQLMSKFKQIEEFMQPPFVVETIAKASTKEKDKDEALEGDEAEVEEGSESSSEAKSRGSGSS